MALDDETNQAPAIASIPFGPHGDDDNPRNAGLWRSVLAEPGGTLPEVFAKLEHSAHVERLARHTGRNLVGARVTLTPEEGEGYWELTRVRDDIHIILTNLRYTNQRLERVPGDGHIQFNFTTSGDMTLAASHAQPLRINRPSLLVWAQSPGADVDLLTAPGAQQRTIAISVRPAYLMEHFLQSITDMPPSLRDFMSSPCEKMGYCRLPLTAQMFELVAKMIDNPLNGKQALLYTEALTLQLMCAAVSSFGSLAAEDSQEYTERTLRCLQAARSVLTRQLAPVPTLRQLSRAVGLSETALTQGFSSLYGETPTSFSVRHRMQHAMTMLRERQCSVDQASEAVGYSHPTSFSTAFQRHFGVRPIDVRHRRSVEAP